MDGEGPMAKLSSMVIELQTVCMNIGISGDYMDSNLALPRMVVLGSQSAGKSSVLENIVGWDFLPRGTGIVTRRPLVLQMVRMSEEEAKQREAQGLPLKYAEFAPEHGKTDVVTMADFQDVRNEIQRRTNALCDTRGVKNIPINLRVKSPQLLNLTLVDLPGLTKVAVEGQHENIGEDIRNMALDWIRPDKTIILAVTAANTDIANSDSLQLAKLVDPKGDRTIGVLTKLDLMDRGTDCLPILTGKTYKLQMGFIGVVNRSQADIESRKDINSSLEDERKYFQSHPVYRPYADKLGTTYLSQMLARTLHKHILACVPRLKSEFNALLDDLHTRLKKDGEDDSHIMPTARLLHLLNAYTNEVTNSLDGEGTRINASQVGRGARINHIFHKYAKSLDDMNPADDLPADVIENSVASCTGTRNRLFIPQNAFEDLVKTCIQKLKVPALKCNGYVYDQMVELACEASVVLKRYPVLRERVEDFAKQLIDDDREQLDQYVECLVDTECARVNTTHPDFFNGGKDIRSMLQAWIAETEEGAAGADLMTDLGDSNLGRVSDVEVKVMRNLTKEYFKIVRRHMQHHTPGSIMFFLVDRVKQKLNAELVREFYDQTKGDAYIETLLREDSDVVKMRQQLRQMEEALRKSLDTLNKIRTMPVTDGN